MLSEWEKKAIDCLKIVVDDINECGAEYYIDKDMLNDIQTLLNLIEKLKKENEDLNNRDTSRLSEIGELRTKNNYLENEIKYYYIPKDKIRELLKRHNIEFAEDTIAMSEQGAFGFMLSIKELLEEG